jgi:hypothetical protein
MQNGDGRLEGFHDSTITSSKFTEGPRSFVKNGCDGLNRVTLEKLLGAWVFGQSCPRLFFVVSKADSKSAAKRDVDGSLISSIEE